MRTAWPANTCSRPQLIVATAIPLSMLVFRASSAREPAHGSGSQIPGSPLERHRAKSCGISAARAGQSHARVSDSLAQDSEVESIGLTHLLASTLESSSSPVSGFLSMCGVQVETLSAAVRNALFVNATLPGKSEESREKLVVRGGKPASGDLSRKANTRTFQIAGPDPGVLPSVEESFKVSQAIAADSSAIVYTPALATRMRNRLTLLYELPLQFAEQRYLEPLLQTIIERLMAVIPGAARGALLLYERPSGNLLLKAHLPPGRPAVSLTLAKNAIDRREGFIWQQGQGMSASQDLSASMVELSCMSGMYAPLVWRQDVLGVVCVDNPSGKRPFEEDDLRLLLAVARYAAMALANRHLQEELQQNATLLGRLLTNFSPSVREGLLRKARQGRLQLGGEKSEVTILCSDIRDFTRLSADLDAQEIVDMLNSYFPALVDAIFRFNGTIDKYVGDSILAVFGSPEVKADKRSGRRMTHRKEGSTRKILMAAATPASRGRTDHLDYECALRLPRTSLHSTAFTADPV